jgi:hypothetical protein
MIIPGFIAYAALSPVSFPLIYVSFLSFLFDDGAALFCTGAGIIRRNV